MKKQAGFTLIELIMVIVILGILSAIALPRFADLSDSAESASLDGVFGAMKSASAIVHASALANNQNGATGEITMEGDFFALVNGYPDAGGAGTITGATTGNGFGLANAAGIDGNYNIEYNGATQAAATAVFVFIDTFDAGVDCVAFSEAAAGGVPTIVKSTFTDAGTADTLDSGDACGTVTF